jgi:lysophospholipid acyltransferase (LPLAT)-like uncharacterized protein
MVKIMKSGVPGAMFPDGPRGPRGDFKLGTVMLAQLAGAYIVPMTHVASRAWVFNSWDKFMIAKPFAKVVVSYGEPIEIPRKMNEHQMAELKTELEAKMNAHIDETERYLKEEWK